ncbi:MAG: TfoX/Sxy family protein [Candidatus Nitronauta litoralis]|uniref:TfoX/Sxy family protein n=1 Tax=Candidatus Nitronauta litoralis TaxID=2705533 RepID=A0A7T0G104_9BACT|nr:MAG: TfoX/Sxy family protein [Candidatus Nitronauta litoralis]
MPYDKGLAERMEGLIDPRQGLVHKKMFGGIGYMLNGNMTFGIWKDFLILRLGLEGADEVLKDDYTKPMDLTGKVMKGWVMVAPEAIAEEDQLQDYMEQAIQFVSTLPAK